MGRFLGLGLVMALLSACGSGAHSGVVPQGAIGVQGHRGSWMKHGTSGEDLIYVSSPDYYPPSHTSSIYVYSYPSGELVGTLTGFQDVGGLCSDAGGNVWVTDATSYTKGGYVYEYAHGATSPTATLTDAYEPSDCTVEPTTGTLAVLSYANVALYSNASGSPSYVSTRPAGEAEALFISYDNSGNLYFAPYKHHPGWLPAGGSVVYKAYIKPKGPHGGYDWDGQYFTVQRGNAISQYKQFNGSSGPPLGSVSLSGPKLYGDYYSIEDSLLAIAQKDSDAVYVYAYPQGGYPTLTIADVPKAYGIAISVTPSRSRRK